MRRRLGLVAALAITVLMASAAPALAIKVDFPNGGSHFHPKGKNYSFLGARIEGTPRSRIVVTVEGGSVLSKRQLEGKLPGSGKMLAVFKINQATDYTIKVTARKRGKKDQATTSYSVPFPDPRRGPYGFLKKAGLHKQWPVK